MPRSLSPATAEQVVAVVEAVVANNGAADAQFVSAFTDLTLAHSSSALALAEDLGLLKPEDGSYACASPLARLLRTPQQSEKAALLRVLLESYEPFIVFREELEASGDAPAAARRTKARLDMSAHQEDIRNTLIGLATFSGALKVAQGGAYERDSKNLSGLLLELGSGSVEQSAAIFRVREELGPSASNTVSHENVILPLAVALRHSAAGAGREAVVNGGNAVETALTEYAERKGIGLAGATGLNAKLDRLQLPSKLKFNGKYLGHLRNAADHGVDEEVGDAWDISGRSGVNFVAVAMAFLRALRTFEEGRFEL